MNHHEMIIVLNTCYFVLIFCCILFSIKGYVMRRQLGDFVDARGILEDILATTVLLIVCIVPLEYIFILR